MQQRRRVLSGCVDRFGWRRLETEKHGGMLTRYVNQGLAPRKTRSSDWHYPVDVWTGADGLNKDALRFWFGHHRELAAFL